MTNQEITQILKNVAAAYTIRDEAKNKFKIIAYQRAADAVEHATLEIKDLWDEGKLNTLPGIGPSITSHLDELFRTGRVKHFEEVLKGLPEAIFPLLKVTGFGAKKAYKIVKNLKLKDKDTVIDDLIAACREHKIAKFPGFGEKSEEDILRNLLEAKQGKIKKARMALPYTDAIAQKIIAYLKKSPQVLRADPLGSLRRRVSTIGDIDIAVATNNQKAVIDYFLEYPGIERVVEKGETGATILTSGGKQVDLRVQKPQSYGSLLQYFTGSKDHNIHLREIALKKGLSLSEYGIKPLKKNQKSIRHPPTGGADKNQNYNSKLKIFEFSTEEGFYGAVDLPWIPPELREDMGEIEAAQKRELPTLVEIGDIVGDVHIHSDFNLEPSHDLGISSMKEIAQKARSLGYQYIAFTDHNPSITNHTEDKIYSILKRRKEAIEQFYQSTKIVRVFNMLEIDILADGRLAVDDKSLSLLDGAIASVHGSFNQPKDKMTRRIIGVLTHPKVKILGHPTGRLLGQREGYEVDWKEIFEVCLKYNKALEINAFPLRLDFPDVLVREAVRKGVKMVISTDAHEVSEMDRMVYGISVARRGWAKKGDILNTLEYNEFWKWLK